MSEKELSDAFLAWLSGPEGHSDTPAFDWVRTEVGAPTGRPDVVGGRAVGPLHSDGEELFELWAYELKMSNWRRALYQALRYHSFANHAVVVMPPAKKRLLVENRALFRKLGVGALVFDPVSQTVTRVVRPKRNKPHRSLAAHRLSAD